MKTSNRELIEMAANSVLEHALQTRWCGTECSVAIDVEGFLARIDGLTGVTESEIMRGWTLREWQRQADHFIEGCLYQARQQRPVPLPADTYSGDVTIVTGGGRV